MTVVSTGTRVVRDSPATGKSALAEIVESRENSSSACVPSSWMVEAQSRQRH
jgi:hypothetical protein